MYTAYEHSGKRVSPAAHCGKSFSSSDRQALVLFLYSVLLFAALSPVGARPRAAPPHFGPAVVAETRRALKATGTPPSSQQGVIEYLSLPNARCTDPLLKNVWGSNAWDCKRRCTASTACEAWSFTTIGWKCELHTACEKKQWDDTYKSGVKVVPESRDNHRVSYKKLPNTQCHDHIVQRAQGTNQGQCRSRCTNNPLCRAFSHDASYNMCDLLTGCASSENSKWFYSEAKKESATESEASQVEDSESSSKPEGPWEGCDGQGTGFREKDDYGCFNPDDGFYAKASNNDIFGGVKYTGYWQSCKNLCSATAQGTIHPDDLECGRGHYMTYNKDTGSCYFYRPPSASSNGCSQWRSKDSDRLGMYCGPEGGSGGDSSSDSEDKPPPSRRPPPTGDSSDFSADAEAGYNRKYSGWLGEYCLESWSTMIRTVKCVGSNKDCRELCASECNKEKECEAFMADYDAAVCELYSKCNVIPIDGCNACDAHSYNVHVCLENCPEDTKPYYLRSSYWLNCNSKNEISSYDTGCVSYDSDGSYVYYCEEDDFERLRDECADSCINTPGCSDFFMPYGYTACQLYTDCDLDYRDGDGGYIGIFRGR